MSAKPAWLAERDALVLRIRAEFPAEPIPDRDPLVGLDPLGRDECAAFWGNPWTAISPGQLSWNGFDVCPAIRFALHEPPHLWNFYFPAFLVGALVHEEEADIVDGVLWKLHEPASRPERREPTRVHWETETIFGGYTTGQVGCIRDFLRFLRDHGGNPPWGLFGWERKDQRALDHFERLIEGGW